MHTNHTISAAKQTPTSHPDPLNLLRGLLPSPLNLTIDVEWSAALPPSTAPGHPLNLLTSPPEGNRGRYTQQDISTNSAPAAIPAPAPTPACRMLPQWELRTMQMQRSH